MERPSLKTERSSDGINYCHLRDGKKETSRFRDTEIGSQAEAKLVIRMANISKIETQGI